MSDLVAIERAGAACVLTLRREAKLNALSTAVEEELADALDTADVRDAACVVLTGAGRAFSAGADVTEFRDRDPETIMRYYRETGEVYERVAALDRPTSGEILTSGSLLGAHMRSPMPWTLAAILLVIGTTRLEKNG